MHPPIPAIAALKIVSTRAQVFLSDIPQTELDFTTYLVIGERTVEIPGRYTPLETPSRPESMVLPDLRSLCDYAKAPCKHECVILKQSRRVRHVHSVWKEGTKNQRALMLSRSGQCGLDTTKAAFVDVEAVASMECPAHYSHMDLGKSIMFSAATLQLHDLPFDSASSA